MQLHEFQSLKDAVVNLTAKVDQILSLLTKASASRAQTESAAPMGEMKTVTDGLRNLFGVLQLNPACEPRWRTFLEQLRGEDKMTQKQWKFFCVIHKECTGEWPPKDPPAPPPAAPAPKPLSEQELKDIF